MLNTNKTKPEVSHKLRVSATSFEKNKIRLMNT